jgi:glycolate oxidase FAD binding subunit
MTPMQGWQMVDEFRRHAGVDAYYDWQGGLIWMRMEADPEAQILRKLIARYGGGHATLVRAPETVRAGIDVFEPQPAALAALSQRLKQQFDPEKILNPGRMHSHQVGA